jgi:hypothetical protein
MSISRSSFEALEGFDRSLASAEDQDFALRFTDAGGRIAFAPEAAGLHDDDALDIRSYCRRVESGTEQLVAFCRRHPDWPENVERERVNGPLSPLSEPPSQSFRKVLKLAVGSRAVKSLVFGIASLLERRSPNGRALELTYRLLIGSHILRGYRRGLIRHAALSNELPVQRVGKQAAAVLQAADKR